MKTRNHEIAWIALLALAFVAGACGRSKTPETAGTPGSEGAAPGAASSAPIDWGVDTLWAEAQIPAAEASKRKISLQFAPDGNVRMTTDYLDRGTGMDVGWWSARNDTLAIQFATIDGKASGTTSTWTVSGTQMTPLVYNKEEWGPDGIPFQILRRPTPSN
jgi:hypothetical protein